MSFNSLFILFGIWLVVFCAEAAGLFEGVSEIIRARRIKRAMKKAMKN